MAKLQNKKDLYAGNNDIFILLTVYPSFFSEYFARIILRTRDIVFPRLDTFIIQNVLF